MEQEQIEPPENKPTNTNKAETIKELADRHLADEHHTTSDEELRNARIVLDDHAEVDDESLYEVDNTTVFPPLPVEESDSTDKKGDNDDNEERDRQKHFPNPYDVLG